MSKLKEKLRKKLDINGDGKVNFKDLVAVLKKKVDIDGDGKISIEEFGNAVTDVIEVVQDVKKF